LDKNKAAVTQPARCCVNLTQEKKIGKVRRNNEPGHWKCSWHFLVIYIFERHGGMLGKPSRHLLHKIKCGHFSKLFHSFMSLKYFSWSFWQR